MFEIKDIRIGILPYGGGAGIKAIGIYVENAEDPFDLTDEDKFKYHIERMVDSIVKHVGDDLFEEAMMAKVQICFIGNGMELKTNAKTVDAFFTSLSKIALEWQKKAKKRVDQLRPPFIVWVGKPLTYTGDRTFYENFNYVITQCPLEFEGQTITKETIGKVHAATALMEIANHNFSMFVFRIKTPDNLDGIDLYLKNTIPVNGDRIIIIPEDFTDKKLVSSCYDYAMKNKMRLGIDYSQFYKEALVF